MKHHQETSKNKALPGNIDWSRSASTSKCCLRWQPEPCARRDAAAAGASNALEHTSCAFSLAMCALVLRGHRRQAVLAYIRTTSLRRQCELVRVRTRAPRVEACCRVRRMVR